MIRNYKKNDLPNIQKISRSLHPKWFDKNALVNIPIDTQINRTFVYEDNRKILGFICISSNEGTTNINWLAVNPENHGQGIGSKLLLHTEEFAKGKSSTKIQVETVIEQQPKDGSYDETMKFYLKHNYDITRRHSQETYKKYTFRKGILSKSL